MYRFCFTSLKEKNIFSFFVRLGQMRFLISFFRFVSICQDFRSEEFIEKNNKKIFIRTLC